MRGCRAKKFNKVNIMTQQLTEPVILAFTVKKVRSKDKRCQCHFITHTNRALSTCDPPAKDKHKNRTACFESSPHLTASEGHGTYLMGSLLFFVHTAQQVSKRERKGEAFEILFLEAVLNPTDKLTFTARPNVMVNCPAFREREAGDAVIFKGCWM